MENESGTSLPNEMEGRDNLEADYLGSYYNFCFYEEIMKLTCFVMLKKAEELDIIKIPWTNHHMLSRKKLV